MADKSYHEMTDKELRACHALWTVLAGGASGFASAYFAAKQIEQIVAEAKVRGIALTNEYPITVGEP
jgi:hypothetical protein